MPIAAAIWAFFAANMIPLLIRALVGIGVGVATYNGCKALLDYALAQVQGLMTSGPADILAWIGFFRMDQAMTILFSALVIRLTLRGLDKATDVLKVGTFNPPTAS